VARRKEKINKDAWVGVLLNVKGWSRVQWMQVICPKLHIAFFTSLLISDTFIILLYNEYTKN
jgi:hypothetical protein